MNKKKGSLWEKISETDQGTLSESMVQMYARQILEGLSHLHLKRIVHGELKVENVLFDKDGVLKLTDFSMSLKFNFENFQW